MPFKCEICGKSYDSDCGAGYECKECGALNSIVRCEENDTNVDEIDGNQT